MIAGDRVKLPTRAGALTHSPISDTLSTAEILDDFRADRV